ncbi:colicin E3/pyocin S6 family cytotoxin [Corynebacterium fournieri]|uniref:colicin E3/pyocin S6 family cytotoxin n=1 Tax=Corynebacterium fournieri TaxID=1852390 RepID=UPI000C7626B5
MRAVRRGGAVVEEGGAELVVEQGLLVEYDPLHGHVEGNNLRGRHIGVFDAVTAGRIGDAVRGRRIDV